MDKNVEMIRNEGIRIIRGGYPLEVRKAWNAAVKNNELKHLKKDRLKPEIYCRPDCLDEAREMQTREALRAIECIRKVCI
jgi:hypothetical protein